MNEPFLFLNPGAMTRNVHTRLADQIGLSIVRGDFKPGQALPSEMRLCEMMKVSRTAVRDALRVLSGKGMVQARPKSGTRVRNVELWNHLDPDVLRWQLAITDLDDYLRKLFQLRFAVEPAAASLAALFATPDDAKRIRAAFDAMAAAETDRVFVDSDIEFHKSIYRATQNQFFWPIAQLFEFALRESFRISSPGGHRKRAIAEHRSLMKAILERSPRKAHAAALLLLGNSAKDVASMTGAARGPRQPKYRSRIRR